MSDGNIKIEEKPKCEHCGREAHPDFACKEYMAHVVAPEAPTATETPEKAPEVENTAKEAEKPKNDGEMMEKGVERNPDGTVKKGSVLNPNGKPKGTLAFKTAIEKWADREAAKEQDGTPVTKLELITKKLIELAEGGNVKAIEMISDRIDGKPKQSIDMTSLGERMGIDPAKQSLVNEAVREMFKKE